MTVGAFGSEIIGVLTSLGQVQIIEGHRRDVRRIQSARYFTRGGSITNDPGISILLDFHPLGWYAWRLEQLIGGI
jgi:hypothetical protein